MTGEKFGRATASWLTFSLVGMVVFLLISSIDGHEINPYATAAFGVVWVSLSLRWGYLIGRMD